MISEQKTTLIIGTPGNKRQPMTWHIASVYIFPEVKIDGKTRIWRERERERDGSVLRLLGRWQEAREERRREISLR